jgi:hypothetical protein
MILRSAASPLRSRFRFTRVRSDAGFVSQRNIGQAVRKKRWQNPFSSWASFFQVEDSLRFFDDIFPGDWFYNPAA